jgi:hypothetical protein
VAVHIKLSYNARRRRKRGDAENSPAELPTVRTIALDTIEQVGTPKGTVRDVEELNTRLGI